MKLVQRINLLAAEIGKQIKSLKVAVGSPSNLQTTEKGNLVGAVNELKSKVDAVEASAAAGAGINDVTPAATTTYSSQKVEQLITAAKATVKNELLDGAAAEFDTLKEVATYIAQDQTGAAALTTAVSHRLRTDEAQVLSAEQKTAVETTLNLGDTNTDFVAAFNGALL